MIIKISEDEYIDYASNYVGICIECGTIHYNVEPDAEGYECEGCAAYKVMGIEQALLTGNVKIIS